MKFLNYMFYRVYKYMEKDDEEPIALASLSITAFLLGTLPIIWFGIPLLVFGWEPKARTSAPFIILTIFFFCVYSYYKTKSKNIIKQYENCAYNEKIPYWIFPIIFIVFSSIGLFEFIICRWIKDNHYDGIVLKWFSELFG